jgi:hypothetical protein
MVAADHFLFLLKNREQFRQHFVHDCVRNAFQFPAAARAEIERAGLIATDNAFSCGPGGVERHGKAGGPRKAPAASNRDDDGHSRYAVERLRGHDEHLI